MANFALDYLDWCKKKGIKDIKQTENRELLNEFYYTEFHPKNPKYEVNGVEYFQALGKL